MNRSARPERDAILNDRYLVRREVASPSNTFAPFARLPAELRLMILKLSLPAQRIISLRVTDGEPTEAIWVPTESKRTNAQTAACYRVQVESRRRYSPLWAVNQESRHFAQMFYRVKLLCTYPKPMQQQYLCFNPETDIIRFNLDTNREALVEVLVDLKDADPRKLGVQNLSISSQFRTTGMLPRHAAAHSQTDIVKFREIIYSLKTVYFEIVKKVTDYSVSMIDDERAIWGDLTCPVTTGCEEFDVVDRDPRKSARNADIVLFDKPSWTHVSWRQMELEFKINHDGNKTEFKYIVRAESYFPVDPHPIHKWQHWYDSVREALSSIRRSSIRFRNERSSTKVADLVSSDDLPLVAVGFWIFPIAAAKHMEELPDRPIHGWGWPVRDDCMGYLDLNQNQLQLALSHLL